MKQIMVRRLDGTEFLTLVNHLACEMGYAMVRRAGDELVIIEDQGFWRETRKYQRGETLLFLLSSKGQPRRGEVIYVLEATADDPLCYVVMPEDQRFPELVAPTEIIEEQNVDRATE